MKILVPVDFYSTSFSAYMYAMRLAEVMDAEITLLNVINGPISTYDIVAFDPYLEIEKATQKRLKFFAYDHPNELGVRVPDIDISLEVRFGLPGFTIAHYADTKDFDLIIMGTRDKHGIFDKLLGSSSTVTIKEAKCPILLIHEDTEYNPIQKIAFGFDHKIELEDSLHAFKKFNARINAKTDFIHINVNSTNDISDQKVEIVEELFEKDQDVKFAFEIKSIVGNQVDTALKEYCLFESVDMLAMVHRSEGIFKRLLHPSHSIRAVRNIHIPIIIFPED